MPNANDALAEDDWFAATLRCDGCQRLQEVHLGAAQAERYVGFIERREFDAAMNVVRRADTYPPGWTQRPATLQRDVLHLDRQSGNLSGSSNLVESFLDFCPDCQAP